jgi:nucleotide-binding universal stress UspA family protein
VNHIVLGTGGGPGSQRSARWAAELAHLLNAELEVVSAYPRRSAEESPEVAEELHERSVTELAEWASTNRVPAAGVQAIERSPEEALARAAEEAHADLVVLGSDEAEGVTSLGLGSIAHRVAHHIGCPLIVVPPGDTDLKGGTIVAGTDGPSGELVRRWADALADAVGGSVTTVSTVDPHESADALRAVAAALDASLIVVSAKAAHNLGGLLLGAVADHLLHRPTRPVAVLPHGYGGCRATGSGGRDGRHSGC